MYSEREITFARDRLPALAGIAKKFCFIRKDRYLAGLWEEDLNIQLAWYRNWSGNPPICDYQAPSWTPISVSGPVCHLQNLTGRNKNYGPETEARIISCRVDLARKDSPFGGVMGGTLTVEVFAFDASQLPWSWHATTVMDRDARPFEDFGQYTNIQYMVLGFRKGDQDADMELHSNPPSDPHVIAYGSWEGLFLLPMDDDTFHRVGFFDSHHCFGYNKDSSGPSTARDLLSSALRRRLKIT